MIFLELILLRYLIFVPLSRQKNKHGNKVFQVI